MYQMYVCEYVMYVCMCMYVWSLLLSGVPSPRPSAPPLPLPPLGSQQKKIRLAFAHFRRFLFVS